MFYIPFVDLKKQYLSIKKQIDNALSQVIEETAFIGGKYVSEFEKKFEEIYKVNNCISVANGTDSLFIIMKMLGIGLGDEVITVANSWISTSETISLTGAKPVFLDIEKEYYTIDVELIENAINSKTKAILPVHLFGQMCDMDYILEIANKYNLFVIEDCAQSHFSEYNSKKAGTFGIAGSFSFYPGKNLGAYGDAGCIITNDFDFARKCKMFARHGSLKKHDHQIEGVNSRLDGLQAAILNVKLHYISEWTKRRIENAKLYEKYLSNVSEVILPKIRPNTVHSFHLYVIRCKKRNELLRYLKSNGIECAIHYPQILPLLPAYDYLNYKSDAFPVAYSFQSEILSLPMYPELTEDMISFISKTIFEFYCINNE